MEYKTSVVDNTAPLFNEDLNFKIEKIIKKNNLCERFEIFKQTETYEHTQRVSEYTRIIANCLGLPKSLKDRLALLAPIHDIGKLLVDQEILNAERALSKEEFEHIKTHSTLGYNLLKGHNCDLLDDAALVAYGHHEKWDGTGYPLGLKGNEIDIFSRIICAADVFDALISERPYKNPWTYEEICGFFIKMRGTQFDPKVADAVINNFNELIDVHQKHKDKTINISLKLVG